MNLTEKILKKISSNEKEIELEDHNLSDSIYYRLHYIEYYRIGENYGINSTGITDWPCDIFTLPSGMNKEDAFKVLSYLSDYIEKKSNLEECSLKSVITLDEVLSLERIGFRKENIVFPSYSEDVIDLFTVAGRLDLFKKSKYYQRYFEWYTPNITKEEIIEIYKKCNIDFYDLVKTR